ncbi:hypothetical protein DIPPA_02451 [Diplonema papillatum]|nr:hypothetical protein DIPPA_02451 [Diplonema papillatum]
MRDHVVRERCRELWASGATPTADQLAEVEVALRRAGYDNDLVLSRATTGKSGHLVAGVSVQRNLPTL